MQYNDYSTVRLDAQVKKSELKETWESSPDRYLLELGGIKTKRPTEQQQQWAQGAGGNVILDQKYVPPDCMHNNYDCS